MADRLKVTVMSQEGTNQHVYEFELPLEKINGLDDLIEIENRFKMNVLAALNDVGHIIQGENA